MKKIFIIANLLLLVVFSCERTDAPIYDGQQTLAYFTQTSSSLEVLINESATKEVTVGVSTLSDQDRTVELMVNEELTSAASDVYSFNTSVVIPANSYTGTFVVNAVDNGLTTSAVNLVIDIVSVSDGGVGSPTPYSLSIVEICPVAPDFAVGDYTLSFVSGGIPAAGFSPPMGNNIVVELVPGAASIERRFNVKFYPAFGFANPPVDVAFTLLCGEVNFIGIVAPGVSGVGCGGSIGFGPSQEPGTYDPGDDTVITLVVTENTNEQCGNSPTQTTYTLTKI
jgi:hypothetical protein